MIYLDLDGPMVNWVKGVYSLWGRAQPELTPDLDMLQDLGVTKGQIWGRITKAGAKWWADLEPQPWAKEMYDELIKIDEVVILTSPSHIPSAHAGKAQWMKKFFGGNFKQYVLTSRKELLASPGDVLIDDHDKNVAAFTQAKGIGVIFPRPWNQAAPDTDQAVIKVFEKIKMLYPRCSPSFLTDDEDKW